jgi:thioredoxin-related protein
MPEPLRVPSILLRLSLVLLFGLAPLAHAVEVPPLTNLRADLAEAGQHRLPVLLLFHTHGCGYCHYVLEDHLKPMILSGKYRQRVLIRQLEAHGGELVDADGRMIEPAALMRRYKVRFFPTLMLLGPEGEVLAEPLVGVANIDLYGTQLESALQKAEARLR